MKSARIVLALFSVTILAVFAADPLIINPHGHQDVYVEQGGLNRRVAVTGGEVVVATNAIKVNETGTTYYLDATTEFVSTLPAPAIGLRYTFICKTAPSGANYTVVANGTGAANDIIIGNQNSVAGDAGDFGTADDTVSFVGGSSVAGDKVEFYSDGTKWYAYAVSKLAAGIVFSDAD